ncbi:MAG: DUF167 family protein [Nanoarchaeota archaeon]
MISDCIEGNNLKIIVKPNSKKTELIGVDTENKVVRIDLKEPAENNRANVELLKFLKKQLKKEVRIKKGLNSKEKILEIL